MVVAVVALSACGEAESVSTHKDPRSFVVEQMRTNPSRVKTYVRRGAKKCAEQKVGGKLPSYVTGFVTTSVMMGVRYAAKNPGKKPRSADLRKLKKKINKKLRSKIQRVAKRLIREKPAVQRRAKAFLAGGTIGGAALGECVMKSAMNGLQEAKAKAAARMVSQKG